MGSLNRRRFLQSSGYACLVGAAPAAAPPRYAYVGSDAGIHVYAVSGGRWRPLQTVPSRRPSFLAFDRQQKFLFAANDVEDYEGLPQGTVEAYRIDQPSGRLHLINRVPLSLSAIRPRHLAISPGNDRVVAASSTGGAYNVFALREDTGLTKPQHICKQIGCGPHPQYQTNSRPHSLLVDGAGNWTASDLGADRLTTFRIHGNKLLPTQIISVRPGDGPGPLAFDHQRHQLLVLNVLDGSVSTYVAGRETARVAIADARNLTSHGALAWRDGEWLAALNTPQESILTLRRCDGTTKSLVGRAKAFYSLVAHPADNGWLIVDRADGQVVMLDSDAQRRTVASVDKPLHLLLKQA